MSTFVLLNWVLLVATAGTLGLVLWRHRSLLIKPSIVVVCLFHIQVQWAATVFSPSIQCYLPRPFDFMVLVHGFPLVGLVGSVFTFRRSASAAWNRITTNRPVLSTRALILLYLPIIVLTLWYLSSVGLESTGLFQMLVNPKLSALARERSLKLLPSTSLKYGFSFLQSVLTPLAGVLLGLRIMASLRERNVRHLIICSCLLVSLMAIVTLPGARAPAAKVLLAILLAGFLMNKMRVRPTRLLLAFLMVMSVPVLLSLLREGRSVNVILFFRYLTGGVFRRAFVVPMETGLWFSHYAQTVGHLGVAGIPKLAALFGVNPVNSANLIYLMYTSAPLQSGLANTGFVFSYYNYFGLISLPLSVVLLWLLDAVVLSYRFISRRLLLATVSAVCVACFSLIESEYTTALVTHGFALIPVVGTLVDWAARLRIKAGNPRIDYPAAWGNSHV